MKKMELRNRLKRRVDVRKETIMRNKYYFLFLILISIAMANICLIVSLTRAEAGTWSQTIQSEFESDTLTNLDTSTNPGDVCLSGAYSSDDDTVLLLHMNESSWNGTTNEVVDSSSYGNHGTAQGTTDGSATTTDAGKFGRAGTFDGDDDYINFGDPADGSLNMGTSDVTIEMWVKRSRTGIQERLYMKRALDNSTWYNIAFSGFDTVQASLASNYPTVNYTAFTSTSTITDSNWHHLAAVFDRDGNGQIYIDGEADGAPVDISSNSGNINDNAIVTVGAWGSLATHFFKGSIDEVRISKKARSPGEMNTSGDYFSSGTIISPAINSGKSVTDIRLNWEDTLPAGTSITYSATNDGGLNWYELSWDNVLFTFPGTGNDLRVKAELNSGSGGTPVLHLWSAEFSGDPSDTVITGRKLELYGEDPVITFTDSTDGELGYIGDSAVFAEDAPPVDSFGIRSEGELRLLTDGNNTRVLIDSTGKVGIGTMNPQSELAVNGTITAKEVEVTTSGWSDYVFNNDYRLLSLEEVETYINDNKHLPGVPSEKEVKSNGISVSEMMKLQMTKIEELTLHVIRLNERIKELEGNIEE